MERILRLMRPSKDEVLIKESGMHAVENFIMSRYQMYWQIYFHPVSRGGEVLLNNCLKRVKQLYNEGTILRCTQKILFLFEEGYN